MSNLKKMMPIFFFAVSLLNGVNKPQSWNQTSFDNCQKIIKYEQKSVTMLVKSLWLKIDLLFRQTN